MGYNGERGSVNQFSDLYNYLENNVKTDLKDLYKENAARDNKINKKELRYYYEPKDVSNEIPLISFDGGMTTLFQGLVAETCLLKIAAGIPPEFEERLKNDNITIQDIFFHTFVGKLNFASDAEEIKATLKIELQRLSSLKEFQSLLSAFSIPLTEFEDKFVNLVNRWTDKSALKDTIRELLEWALIMDFLYKHSTKEIDGNKLPFLIIKDGNISSNPKAVTTAISQKIKALLTGEIPAIPFPLIVGAVKSSRFTGESPLGRTIKRFGEKLPSHTFFRLPTNYEVLLDKGFADQPFDRYFLNLFQGESVYEIQIPKVISKNQEILETVLDLIASQITFKYGGSIVTNSYAHEQASISAAEGQLLENKISQELDEEIDNE
jgi:hypothetical protein